MRRRMMSRMLMWMKGAMRWVVTGDEDEIEIGFCACLCGFDSHEQGEDSGGIE
jgi:hypothetical protein